MSHLQKRLGLFILGFLMVAFTIPPDFIIAQDDAQGWPVVQRCLTPTAAPEGWTYTGTILLDGYAGIHGVNADWATPRVLVFLNWPSKASARALSPDGNWLAVATQSHLEEAESDRWLTVFVDRIDIYSTLHFRETYSLPWSNQYTISTQRRSRT
ncbi:MAG TPA: hypothetical protein VHP83_11935, partial [Aggregatilineaceae bacterium]|nr:hypothetical protein [Aggregatilineaceae bacterium]